MEEILYYPLVDMGTDGTDKQPMFPAKDPSSVAESHALWLKEIVPHHFRLGANEAPTVDAVKAFRVHCPRCGKVMKAVSGGPLPLYVCDVCRNNG